MRLGLLIFTVLLSQPVMAGNIIDSIPLSEQCKEQVTEYNLSGYEITGDTEINVSSRTDAEKRRLSLYHPLFRNLKGCIQ